MYGYCYNIDETSFFPDEEKTYNLSNPYTRASSFPPTVYTPPDRGGAGSSHKSDNSASNRKDYTGLTPRETFEKKHGINRHSQESSRSESCLPSYVWPLTVSSSRDSGSCQRKLTQTLCDHLMMTQYLSSNPSWIYILYLIFLKSSEQKLVVMISGTMWSPTCLLNPPNQALQWTGSQSERGGPASLDTGN